MDYHLVNLVERTLPALSGSKVTYNSGRNMYMTDGYTSAMGHTYCSGLCLSNRIIINFSLGFGSYNNAVFLNGITIYGYNGSSKRMIASRQYHCYFFDKNNARWECVNMVKEYLLSQMKMHQASVNMSQLNNLAKGLVDEALRNNPTMLKAC